MVKITEQLYYKSRSPRSISRQVVKSTIQEILSIAETKINKPLKELTVLDVGSGTGDYSFELEKYVLKVVGVEPYKSVYLEAIQRKIRLSSKVIFRNQAIEDFKTKERFDLVISLTTIEHMPNAQKSFERIFGLMRKGGIIYLTAPNKWWPFEHHYRLPFLSWLPLPLANLYVKFMGRGKSYKDSAYAKSYFGMRKFFDKFPCEYEFVLPTNPNSPYIGCGETSKTYHFLKNLGIWAIKKYPAFWAFSKGFIMVLKKR